MHDHDEETDGMRYARIPDELTDWPTPQRWVAVWLYQQAARNGYRGLRYPIRDIAVLTGLTTHAVRTALSMMEEAGYLVRGLNKSFHLADGFGVPGEVRTEPAQKPHRVPQEEPGSSANPRTETAQNPHKYRGAYTPMLDLDLENRSCLEPVSDALSGDSQGSSVERRDPGTPDPQEEPSDARQKLVLRPPEAYESEPTLFNAGTTYRRAVDFWLQEAAPKVGWHKPRPPGERSKLAQRVRREIEAHGLDAVLDAMRFVAHGRHSRAEFFRERRYGLITVLRHVHDYAELWGQERHEHEQRQARRTDLQAAQAERARMEATRRQPAPATDDDEDIPV